MLNKQKGNMYGFVTHTWNPIKGKCSHDCSYCLDGETLILMSDLSYKKIRNVNVGDKIIGIKKGENYKFMREAIVQNKVKKEDIAFKIITEDTEVICSSDHEWLIERGKWKNKVNGLKVGNRIKLVNNSLVSEQNNVDDFYKQGYLRGMIKGDANFKTYKSKEQKIIRNNKEYIYSPKIVYKFRLALKDIEALNRTKKYLNYFGINVFDHIHDGLNSIRKDGKKSFRRIEEIISFNKNSQFLAGFLGGMFDAEGSFNSGALRIHNQQISELLVALDFFGFEYHINKRKNTVYTITLRGGFDEQVRFFNLTNPSILRKRKRFLKAIKKGYSKILSIECIGMRELYDIQTTTGNFIANGLISHNCYMKRFPQGELRLDEKSLKDNLGKDNFIFVGSSTDMFAKDVPLQWIYKVIKYCKKFPENTYLFQTKNPERFVTLRDELISLNCVIGTTIETNREVGLRYSKAPPIITRIVTMSEIKGFRKMVTIEPIFDFDVEKFIENLRMIEPEWINIGADSKRHNLPEPNEKKLKELISSLKCFTKVKLKDNLKRLGDFTLSERNFPIINHRKGT